jgi:hypothetical protein
MGGLGQLGGMNGMGGGGRSGMANRRGIGVQQLIRPQIVVSMDRAPALTPPLIAQVASNTFTQAQNFSGFQGVNVNVNEAGVATLSGTAVTARDRTIAHAMLAMQPGVRSVQNQMTVSPPANLPPIAQPTSGR